MTRIALATYAQLPQLDDDDRLLLAPLAALGLEAVPTVWDAPDAPWDEFAAVLVRSCWDYHRRLDEFLGWVARLETMGVPLWNPPALLRWNSHKRYLRDLGATGVATAPTRWLRRGEDVVLAELLRAEEWPDAVVKPAVSASAFGTWRASLVTAAQDQARLAELLAVGDVLVQPYLAEVRAPGEWSLLFYGGRYSHAVLKRPAAGDFRVQWEFGGSAVTAAPPARLVGDAERVLQLAPGKALYARVDGVEGGGSLILTELELIEPHLFLGWHRDAAARLARACATALG